jgi:hypothetical protein
MEGPATGDREKAPGSGVVLRSSKALQTTNHKDLSKKSVPKAESIYLT